MKYSDHVRRGWMEQGRKLAIFEAAEESLLIAAQSARALVALRTTLTDIGVNETEDPWVQQVGDTVVIEARVTSLNRVEIIERLFSLYASWQKWKDAPDGLMVEFSATNDAIECTLKAVSPSVEYRVGIKRFLNDDEKRTLRQLGKITTHTYETINC